MDSLNEDLSVQIPRDATSHLSGKLDIINITDLIQLLNTTKLSGLLHVIDDKQTKAQLVFEHGEIIKASYGNRKSEQAVYAVMCIKDGSFDFVGGLMEEDAGQEIDKRTVSMLLEGARRIDERGEKEKTQPIDVAV